MEILFYHLERASLDQVLPGLLEKTLQRGWKALVVTATRDQVSALDGHLWTFRDVSFLPHGTMAQSVDPAEEPVLLVSMDGEQAGEPDRASLFAPANQADVLFMVNGVIAEPGQMQGFARCVVIFDGRDDQAVSGARKFWQALRDHGAGEGGQGFTQTYWRQSASGRWENPAPTPQG